MRHILFLQPASGPEPMDQPAQLLALLAAGGLPADWAQTWLTLDPLPELRAQSPQALDPSPERAGPVPEAPAAVPTGAAKTLIEALLLATDVAVLLPAQAEALAQHARLLAHLHAWQHLHLLDYRDWMRGKRFALIATLAPAGVAEAEVLDAAVRSAPAQWQALCAELDCDWHGALLGQPDAQGSVLTDVAAGFAAQGFLARSAARPLAHAQTHETRMAYLAACARACACAR
ncbi:MAG TPA: hypothetical protein VFK82_04120 [Burkholderiaceae bacterium]|nr:hypothetical protein [Burkholderiaceae bacterium]